MQGPLDGFKGLVQESKDGWRLRDSEELSYVGHTGDIHVNYMFIT